MKIIQKAKKAGRKEMERQSKPKNKHFLDRKTIVKATEGDVASMIKVVNYYKPQIERFAKRLEIDDNGNCRYGVDENIKFALEMGLITAILNFKNQ